MAVLLLGIAALAHQASSPISPRILHGSQAEHPATGETTPEEFPFQRRRLISLRMNDTAAMRPAGPIAVAPASASAQRQTHADPQSRAEAPSPWAALPGRRVQRGQAPPVV